MEICNMTVTFVLDNHIKLPPVGLHGVRYDKKRFNGAIWKNAGLVFLIFDNGKINCVGGKNIDDVNGGMIELLSCLEEDCEIIDSKIVNLVGSTTLSFTMDLRVLYEKLRQDEINATYEPELFAGLTLRTHGATLLCFHTGKFIVTGVKQHYQFGEVFNFMFEYFCYAGKSSIKGLQH